SVCLAVPVVSGEAPGRHAGRALLDADAVGIEQQRAPRTVGSGEVRCAREVEVLFAGDLREATVAGLRTAARRQLAVVVSVLVRPDDEAAGGASPRPRAHQ